MIFRVIFFFKQKTAYEMRISDWSSDVCSSDLILAVGQFNSVPHREIDPRITLARDIAVAVASKPTVVSGRWPAAVDHGEPPCAQIGRASCRVRVCQYV